MSKISNPDAVSKISNPDAMSKISNPDAVSKISNPDVGSRMSTDAKLPTHKTQITFKMRVFGTVIY